MYKCIDHVVISMHTFAKHTYIVHVYTCTCIYTAHCLSVHTYSKVAVHIEYHLHILTTSAHIVLDYTRSRRWPYEALTDLNLLGPYSTALWTNGGLYESIHHFFYYGQLDGRRYEIDRPLRERHDSLDWCDSKTILNCRVAPSLTPIEPSMM